MDLFDFKPQLASGRESRCLMNCPRQKRRWVWRTHRLLGPVSGFQPSGRLRPFHERPVAAHGPACGRPLCSARACRPIVRIIRWPSGSSTPAISLMWFPRWDPGCPTAWARRTNNFLRTSRSFPAKANGTTAAPSCRRFIRAPRFRTWRPRRRTLPSATLRTSRCPRDVQRRRIDLIQSMNRRQLDRLQADQQMEGVIESFELAFRMQTETPRLVDLVVRVAGHA